MIAGGRRRVSASFLVFALLPWLTAMAPAIPEMERGRIEYLIASIAALQGAQFLRNGAAHDAASAADHLRLKWSKAGSRVKNAEDFIRYCATQSSMSGQPYEIRFADGRVVKTAQYLQQKLAEYDAAQSRAGSAH